MQRKRRSKLPALPIALIIAAAILIGSIVPAWTITATTGTLKLVSSDDAPVATPVNGNDVASLPTPLSTATPSPVPSPSPLNPPESIVREPTPTAVVNVTNNYYLDLADGSVTNPKLASEAVTSDKIRDETITSTDLANSAVTSTELADNAVTAGKV